jgi:hypothetical protein
MIRSLSSSSVKSVSSKSVNGYFFSVLIDFSLYPSLNINLTSKSFLFKLETPYSKDLNSSYLRSYCFYFSLVSFYSSRALTFRFTLSLKFFFMVSNSFKTFGSVFGYLSEARCYYSSLESLDLPFDILYFLTLSSTERI